MEQPKDYASEREPYLREHDYEDARLSEGLAPVPHRHHHRFGGSAHRCGWVCVADARRWGVTSMLRIELPWPDRKLHPNARPHYMEKARRAKKARADGVAATKIAGLRGVAADALHVTITICPPNNRARDTDGILSSLKSYFDGIVDVIGVDDSKWTFGAPIRGEVRKGGSILVDLEVKRGIGV